MLKETRYMSNIAGTLLQALRRERAGEIFEASDPRKALEDATAALRPSTKSMGVMLVEDFAEAPRVDVPEHVIAEVVRGLLNNALDALKGQENGCDLGAYSALSHRRRQLWRGLKTTVPAFRRVYGSIFSSRLCRIVRAASGWGLGSFWLPACWICMMAASGMR